MSKRPWHSLRLVIPMLSALLLLVAVSCGGSATSTSAPQATAVPAAATTAVPTAVPAAATAAVGPSGSLDIGFKEMGTYQGNTRLVGFPQKGYGILAAYETLVTVDTDGQYVGKLAKEWDISSDNLTWTFTLNKGMQFHGGWGEYTAHDFIFATEEGLTEGTINDSASQGRRIFQHADGHFKALDDYTLELNTGIPAWDVFYWASNGVNSQAWGISQAQWNDLVGSIGEDAANAQLVGTGPWEMVEHRTGEVWNFKAFPDHYRKTPYFAELNFFEIPEESTRVANFQVGKIDTFAAAPDTLPVLAEVAGTKFMSQAGSSHSALHLYGQWYTAAGTPEEPPGWDPGAPYVSSNPALDSPEWASALKVRRALGMGIDRQKIIDELLGGEGEPLPMWGWASSALPERPASWTWDYDVEGAKALLTEAGYEDGFEIDLFPAIRGSPAEVEACEAVADMWQDIGVTAHIQRVPYSVIGPQMQARSLQGATCHGTFPKLEPLNLMSFQIDPVSSWSSGIDHPGLTEIYYDAREIFNTADRWKATTAIGQFMWDNVMSIGLYTQNNVYPLGPDLDPWDENLEKGDTRRLSGLEWAPHRQ